MKPAETIFLAMAEVFNGVTISILPDHADTSDHQALQKLNSRVSKLRTQFANDGSGYIDKACSILNSEVEVFEKCAARIDRFCKELESFKSEVTTVHRSVGRGVQDALNQASCTCYVLQGEDILDSIKKIFNGHDFSGVINESVLVKGIGSEASYKRLLLSLSNVITSSYSRFDSISKRHAELESNISRFLKSDLPEAVYRQHLVCPSGVDGTEMESLKLSDVSGPNIGFLAHSKPPKLSALRCSDAITFFLNVAEDVADGSIECGAKTKLVSSTYNRFMESLKKLDRAIGKLNQSRFSDLQSKKNACEKIARMIDHPPEFTLLEKKWASLLRDFKFGKRLVQNALIQAQLGNPRKAKKLYENGRNKSLDLIAEPRVLQTIKTEESKLKNLQTTFAEIKSQCDYHTSGSRKVLGGNRDELREELKQMKTQLQNIRWAAGSSLATSVIPWFSTLPLAVELAGESIVKIPGWVSFSQRMSSLTPRVFEPEFIFIHALCSIAVGDGEFSSDEKNFVAQILQQEMPD